MYVKDKYSQDPHVIKVSRQSENRFTRFARRTFFPRPTSPSYTFNLHQNDGINPTKLIPSEKQNAVAVIHWIDGFLSIESIQHLAEEFNGAVVWVVHDLEPLTGGCHYSFNCNRYQSVCGRCPQLFSDCERDHTYRVWIKKKRLLSKHPIHFLATTGWGERKVRESSLFTHNPLSKIPLPIDTTIYRPDPAGNARQALQLPPQSKILLCGASYLDDIRKGFSLLAQAIHHLDKALLDNLVLLTVGLNEDGRFQQLPMKVRHLGEIGSQYLMSLIYQAADLFLNSSIEDSGPMMIPEAMLCGTPVVAFDTGGAPDWIEHQVNGYLAKHADVSDFAAGIVKMLSMDKSAVSKAARSKVENLHNPSSVAIQHVQLYQSLIQHSVK